MATLKSLGKATAAILKSIIAPQVGRNELADAVGYIENAGAPTSVTPDFIGQWLFDTSNTDWYRAYGTSSGNWTLLSLEGLDATELGFLNGATAGTQVASKVVVADANVNTGVSKVTELHIGTSGAETQVLATGAEINRAADVSTRVVNQTTATLTVTEAAHDKKIIVLDRADGIAVTLPAASAGLEFEFIVKTTFTGAASIKSVASADIMIGHALMGNDSDNTVVLWQSLAASTNDTIDLFGTANSTGGIAGQRIRILGLAANLWHVDITGDAAGTEATPFANTVA